MQHGALGQVQTNVILDRTTGRHRTIANNDFVSGVRDKIHKSIMAAAHRTSSCNISVSDGHEAISNNISVSDKNTEHSHAMSIRVAGPEPCHTKP